MGDLTDAGYLQGLTTVKHNLIFIWDCTRGRGQVFF